MRNLNELQQYRAIDWELRLGRLGDATGGCFLLEYCGVELRIVASNGGGWDHLSVSTADRCPTWMEMEHVRKIFGKSYEIWVQFGVPSTEHINFHPYCLHWWRHHHREIRLPPSNMIGPRV